MKKKLLTLFAVLCTSLSLLADGTNINGIYYILASDSAIVTYTGTGSYVGNSYSGAITIPSSVTYSGTTYRVTSIGSSAFRGCAGLTSITIPSSVTSIGNYAFSGCTGLTSITIPNSVTSIGENAFSGCTGLTSVNLPSALQRISGGAFYGCTSLTSVAIPASVTNMGTGVFSQCTNLTSITWNVEECNKFYPLVPPFEGLTNVKSFVFGSSVRNIPQCLCDGLSGLTSITIPESVEKIGDFAFADCTNVTSVVWNAVNCADFSSGGYNAFISLSSAKSVTFGPSVQYIPAYMCYGFDSITSITLPSSLESIGKYAFYGCSGLTSVTIPNSVTSIGNYAFEGCTGLTSVTWNSINHADFSASPFSGLTSITSFTFGNTVQRIPARLCYNLSGLQSISLPASVESIGASAFYGCTGLKNVTIPENVLYVCQDAFYGCTLTTLTWNAKNATISTSLVKPYYNLLTNVTNMYFGNTVQSIPKYICYGMSLNYVLIGDGVKTIGEYAFASSGLSQIIMGNAVDSIGDYAFSSCKGLTSVAIPSSVTSIGIKAFSYCTGLTDIVWKAKNCTSPSSSSNAPFYDATSQITSFVFGDSVQFIPACCCSGMSQLSSITIPNSVTSIDWDAFSGCTGLTSVTIGTSVTSIGAAAFKNCSGLTSVTLPNSVTSIGDWAFQECTSLASITIPNSVTSIGDYSFYGCTGFTQPIYNTKYFVRMPLAFSGAYTIPSPITTILPSAFSGCTALSAVTLPSTVTTVGDLAFSECTKLKQITCYPTIPPTMNSNSFANYNVFLYVPCNNLMDYQTDAAWGSFKYIQCIGSEESTTTEFTIKGGTTDATFEWPTNAAASTYVMTITKDGIVFCTLTFNANGQLMNIAFAPSRDGSVNAPAAEMTATGYKFTVTGLETASLYSYDFKALDSSDAALTTNTGTFSTSGYTPTALENIDGVNDIQNTKILVNGRLVIRRGNTLYDANGRKL